jgi:hypothetical protein
MLQLLLVLKLPALVGHFIAFTGIFFIHCKQDSTINQVEKGNVQIEHCRTNNMIGDFFTKSLCKSRNFKDFGAISLDANATYQDTCQTRRDVTQDKEQFEEQKILSSGKIRSLLKQLFIV